MGVQEKLKRGEYVELTMILLDVVKEKSIPEEFACHMLTEEQMILAEQLLLREQRFVMAKIIADIQAPLTAGYV